MCVPIQLISEAYRQKRRFLTLKMLKSMFWVNKFTSQTHDMGVEGNGGGVAVTRYFSVSCTV